MPRPKGKQVALDVANFDNNLSGSDTDVQKAMETLDDVVGGGGVAALNDVGDVTISSPTDKELLIYDDGTSEWINATPAEAGVLALAGGTMVGAIAMGDNIIHTLADAIDLDDAVNLDQVLDLFSAAIGYYFGSGNAFDPTLTESPAVYNETVNSSPQTLSTIFFKSSVADTPAPFTLDTGEIVLVHFGAYVNSISGRRRITLKLQLGYVDADGTSNFVQIGEDSDETELLTTDDTVIHAVHIHVTSAITVPAGKRLWLKFIATTQSGTQDVIVYVQYDTHTSHITAPVSAGILGNYLQLVGGVMTGDIAFPTGKGIRASSSDGSDDQVTHMSGGGAHVVSRGAVVQAYGNEHGILPGQLHLVGGDVANGDIVLHSENGERVRARAEGLLVTGSIEETDHAMFNAYRTDTFDMPANNTWYDYPWNVEATVQTNVTHDHTGVADPVQEIKLDVGGTYMFSWMLNPADGAIHYVSHLLDDGTEIPGSHRQTRSDANERQPMCGFIVAAVGAGSVIKLQAGTSYAGSDIRYYDDADMPNAATFVSASISIVRIGP